METPSRASGEAQSAARIAQLEAEARAFDNVREALDHAEREIAQLREALTYYAEGRLWDNGEVARESLASPPLEEDEFLPPSDVPPLREDEERPAAYPPEKGASNV